MTEPTVPGQAGLASAAPDPGPVRVLIADDQSMVRGSFRVLVDHTPGLTAVGEAATGTEAVELVRREQPDVVLMDIRMPGLDGIEATRRICADPSTVSARVLILTTFDLDEYVYAALRAGAAGFLLKDTTPSEVLNAITVIAAGDSLLAPSVTRRLIADFARRPEPGRPPARTLDGVTDRELEVLSLIARGLSNAELAEHLHLSLATVKTHIGRLLSKLRARDRAQLVIVAYETGLVTSGRPGL
ncbi:response regulator [Streptomyces sp. NPDC059970]|uniref:response regulator n=1 Tax=Streptomyces sp. NPDC059970 TaxID=3347019 RepID=UPI00369DDC3C